MQRAADLLGSFETATFSFFLPIDHIDCRISSYSSFFFCWRLIDSYFCIRLLDFRVDALGHLKLIFPSASFLTALSQRYETIQQPPALSFQYLYLNAPLIRISSRMGKGEGIYPDLSWHQRKWNKIFCRKLHLHHSFLLRLTCRRKRFQAWTRLAEKQLAL